MIDQLQFVLRQTKPCWFVGRLKREQVRLIGHGTARTYFHHVASMPPAHLSDQHMLRDTLDLDDGNCYPVDR